MKNLREKLQWTRAGLENAVQNIKTAVQTTRGKALGIAAAASLAACTKDSVEEPIKITEPIEVVEPVETGPSVTEKRAEVETFLENAKPVFRLSGPTELELPYSLTELTENGTINWDNVVVYPKNYLEVVGKGRKNRATIHRRTLQCGQCHPDRTRNRDAYITRFTIRFFRGKFGGDRKFFKRTVYHCVVRA